MFGDVDYDPKQAFSGAVPLEEQLEALGRAVCMAYRPLLQTCILCTHSFD